MKCKSVLFLFSLSVLGCGQTSISSQTESLQFQSPVKYDDDAEEDEPRAAGGIQQQSGSGSDYFHCFESGGCVAPALSSSKNCLDGRDYNTTISDNGSGILVLSFHGGEIEPGSSGVASALASRFHFNHYDFSAHGSDSCLNGLSDLRRLHITATHFDDPAAVSIMQTHQKAVSIHGYSASRSNHKGTICVGGANTAQVSAFISYVEKNQDSFTLYDVIPVNAATAEQVAGADCSGLAGTSSKNLVNRVAGSAGGLQLEMNRAIKMDLLDPDPKFEALRNLVYGGVNAALTK